MATKFNWTFIPLLGFPLEIIVSILMGLDFMINAILAVIGVIGCLPLGALTFYLLAYQEPFPTPHDSNFWSVPMDDLKIWFYLTTTIRFFWAIVVGLITVVLVFRTCCAHVNKSIYLWTGPGTRNWENWESWKLIQSLWILLYIGILLTLSILKFFDYQSQNQLNKQGTPKNDAKDSAEPQFEFPAPTIYAYAGGRVLPADTEFIRLIVKLLQFLILYNAYKMWVVCTYVSQLKARYYGVAVKNRDEEKIGKIGEIDAMMKDWVSLSKTDGNSAPLKIAIYQTIVNIVTLIVYGFSLIKMVLFDLLSYQTLYYSPSPSNYVIGTLLSLETFYNQHLILLASVALTIFSFICSVVWLHASLALWKGAVERDPTKCRFWTISQDAYIIILGLQLIYGITNGCLSASLAFLLISTVFNGWMLRLVNGFVKNISNPELSNAQKNDGQTSPGVA